jgi:hypothetical protein
MVGRTFEGFPMPKNRCTPELTERIANAIAVYGLDQAGWKAGQISEPTFYRWMNESPEFNEAIQKARWEYREANGDNMKRLANQALLGYLKGDMSKVVHTKKQAFGRSGEVEELEEWKTIPCGVPQWAIDRALGKGMSEIEMIAGLAELGILPAEVVHHANRILEEARTKISRLLRGALPDQPDSQSSTATQKNDYKGIDDETAFAIKAKILDSLGVKLTPNASEKSSETAESEL